MQKIDINDENVDMYQEFYEIKQGEYCIFSNKTSLRLLEILLTSVMTVGGLIGYYCCQYVVIKTLSYFSTPPHSETIINIYKISTNCYFIIYGILMFNVIMKVRKKNDKIIIKDFEKKYPDFDMNIDIDELKKELNKYKKSFKISEKQKDNDDLPKLQNNNFKEMTNQEKIAFLEETKEFIIQEQQNKELTLDEIKANENNYQKKIGSI